MAGQFGFGGFAESLASGRESRQQGRLLRGRQELEEREFGLRESQFKAGLAKEMAGEIKIVKAQIRATNNLIAEKLGAGLSVEDIPGLVKTAEVMLTTLGKFDTAAAIQLGGELNSALNTPSTVRKEAGIAARGEVAGAEATAAELTARGTPTTLEATARAQGLLPAPVTPSVPVSAFMDEFGNLKTTVTNSMRNTVNQLFKSEMDAFGNFRLLNPDDAPTALSILATAEALLLGGHEQSAGAAARTAAKQFGIPFPEDIVKPSGQPTAPVTGLDVPVDGGVIVFDGKPHDIIRRLPNGNLFIRDREGGPPFTVRPE